MEPCGPRLLFPSFQKLVFKGTTHESCIYGGTCRGEDIIIFIQVDEFVLYSLGEQILKYLINELGRKVSIVAEGNTMKRFNGDDIYQTRLCAKNNCGGFIRAVIESCGWSNPVKKEAKFIEPIHLDSSK